LLDKDNEAIIRFTADEEYDVEIEEDSQKNSDEDGSDDDSDEYEAPPSSDHVEYQVSYSDYLAAIMDPNTICGDMNIDLLFHTLNPSDLSDKILKKEMKKALFASKDEDPDAIEGFEKLKIKNKSGQLIFSKSWLRNYFKKIKKILTHKK